MRYQVQFRECESVSVSVRRLSESDSVVLGDSSTFEEAMNVRYQVQFRDQQMRRSCSQRGPGRSTNNVGEVSNRPRPK